MVGSMLPVQWYSARCSSVRLCCSKTTAGWPTRHQRPHMYVFQRRVLKIPPNPEFPSTSENEATAVNLGGRSDRIVGGRERHGGGAVGSLVRIQKKTRAGCCWAGVQSGTRTGHRASSNPFTNHRGLKEKKRPAPENDQLACYTESSLQSLTAVLQTARGCVSPGCWDVGKLLHEINKICSKGLHNLRQPEERTGDRDAQERLVLTWSKLASACPEISGAPATFLEGAHKNTLGRQKLTHGAPSRGPQKCNRQARGGAHDLTRAS